MVDIKKQFGFFKNYIRRIGYSMAILGVTVSAAICLTMILHTQNLILGTMLGTVLAIILCAAIIETILYFIEKNVSAAIDDGEFKGIEKQFKIREEDEEDE